MSSSWRPHTLFFGSNSTSLVRQLLVGAPMDWWGLAAVVVLYILIAAAGVGAAWYASRHKHNVSGTDEVMLAGRDIGFGLGVFTMIASWVGGGFINGTAEEVFKNGILNCQAPLAYSLSLVIVGLFFARRMREAGYLTYLDPFRIQHGGGIGALMSIPAIIGDVLWSAAILVALGASIAVILNIDQTASIIASSVVATGYTFLGGLLAVAFTDVLQLFCMVIGLFLCIPFTYSETSVVNGNLHGGGDYLWGHIDYPGQYFDSFLVMMLGGVPWQAIFQRVLSMREPRWSRHVCLIGAAGAMTLAIAPAVMGVAALRLPDDSVVKEAMKTYPTLALPLMVKYTTPAIVGYIGLGALAAAVMSSCDSAVLSSSTVFSHNVFRGFIYPEAPDWLVLWVLRGTILFMGVSSCVLALVVKQTYVLFLLCSDLSYVLLFPQLVFVVYLPQYTHRLGVLAGFVTGCVVRMIGGVPELGLHLVDIHPDVPMRTISALANTLVTLAVSALVLRLGFDNHRQARVHDENWMQNKDKEKKKEIEMTVEKIQTTV